jgi:PKD repeat protein
MPFFSKVSLVKRNLLTFLSFAVSLVAGLGAQNVYLIPTSLSTSYAVVGNVGGAAVGDYVLVYQHQGAQVSSETETAGELIDLAGAGSYAITVIDRIAGDTVFFLNPIGENFDRAFTQLVLDRGPEMRTVMNAQATPFDGRTGGILFRAADQQLTVAGTLNASAAGFRGGQGVQAPPSCNFITVANNPTYPAGDFRGSRRGEGVSVAPAGQELGRAPLANGGGGGNDHNSGGGGGGNVSAGGAGAQNIVNDPFRCRGLFPGRGGFGLPERPDRIYFGGGGGAGHANNTDGSAGGHGGGLIVLSAPQINFTNTARLSADGADAPTINGDGAPGGGAAGSVLLLATTLSGSPEVSLTGGAGGSTTNQPDRCFGPGGGGSGGHLQVKGDRSAFSPDLSLSGGAFGRRLGSADCEEDESPPQSGASGATSDIESTAPVSSFTLSDTRFCANESLRLTDRSSGADTTLYTVSPSPVGLRVSGLADGLEISFADSTSGTYQITQVLVAGTDTITGQTTSFTVDGLPRADTLLVEQTGDEIRVRVVGARDYQQIVYDFGDSTVVVTADTTIEHRYAEPGTYSVSAVLVSDRCGQTPLLIVPVNAAERAEAIIFEKDPSGCAPLNISPIDLSEGDYTGRRWEFPGGLPATSAEERPTVTYAEPGLYTARLTLVGAAGADTVTTLEVTVFSTPRVDFSFTETEGTVVFDNLSDTGTTSEWDFGDGTTSEEFSPTHTYANPGTYDVRLITRGEFCSDTLIRQVVVDVVNSIHDLRRLGVSVFPNPTTQIVYLRGPATLTDVYDMRGRRIAHQDRQVDLGAMPRGHYILRISTKGKEYSVVILRE